MRILIISHTYVSTINHQKLDALAKFDDIDLFLIVPYKWRSSLKTYRLERSYAENYKIISVQTMLDNYQSTYSYISLSKYIRQVRPDIIHIEEEPWTVSAFQSLRSRGVSGSKTILFTWENICYNHVFPFSLFEKYVLHNIDYAIAGSSGAKDVLIMKGFKKPIKVLPQLGVDPEVFKKRQDQLFRIPELRGFVIGFIGRIVESKGIITLVKAALKISQKFTLLIIGRGPLKSRVINMAKEAGILNKIVFVDTVPHGEIPKYLNCMDVLVLPSLTTPKWKEQFGHVLIETMSCGVPVVGSSSGAIPEVIGDVGLIFDEGNIDDLCGKLLMLMKDKSLTDKLSKKGRERVLTNYTWERIAEETHMIYRDVISDV